jgi:hypothetical protein
VGDTDRIDVAWDRDSWRALVNVVVKFRLYKGTLLHGVR